MAGETVLAKLAVQIAANTAEFNKGLSSAQNNFSKFTNGLRNIASTIAVTFGLKEVAAFGFEVSKLAGEAEGVEIAFKRLKNSSDVLQELTQATGGTVSQLKLMKAAVQASNFQIPIENLAQLFKFATLRAQQTGQSVDYLVESIILGIGRKSPLILDNLGISAVRLREKLHGVGTETASVGDIARVVGDIATEELGNMAGFSENASSKLQRLSASWENLKVAIGKAANENGIFNAVLDKTTELFDDLAGKNDFKGGSNLLGAAIGQGASDAALKDLIDQFKTLRRETGKPLPFESEALIEKFNLTGEQADRLKSKIIEINETLSFQEKVIQKIQERNQSKGYNDLARAAEDYKNSLYQAILNAQILSKQNVGGIITDAGRQAEESVKTFRRAIAVIGEYQKTLTANPEAEKINNLDALKAKLKELNDQFEATDIVDKNKLVNIGNEIIATQKLIDKIEQLRKAREKFFVAPESVLTKTTAPNAKKDFENLATKKKELTEFDKELDKSLQKLELVPQRFEKFKGVILDMSGLIANGISDVANALGEAFSGTQDFGKGLLKAVISFAKQFGEILISLGVAALAAKKLAVKPETAIIAGVALVAIAGAASAALNRSQANYNSGTSGGGGSSSVSSGRSYSNVGNSNTQDTLSLVGVIRGQDLYITLNNYNRNGGRLKG